MSVLKQHGALTSIMIKIWFLCSKVSMQRTMWGWSSALRTATSFLSSSTNAASVTRLKWIDFIAYVISYFFDGLACGSMSSPLWPLSTIDLKAGSVCPNDSRFRTEFDLLDPKVCWWLPSGFQRQFCAIQPQTGIRPQSWSSFSRRKVSCKFLRADPPTTSSRFLTCTDNQTNS